MRNHLVAGRQHVPCDLRLHRIHVIHQCGRRDNAAQKNRRGCQQDACTLAARAAPVPVSPLPASSECSTVSSIERGSAIPTGDSPHSHDVPGDPRSAGLQGRIELLGSGGGRRGVFRRVQALKFRIAVKKSQLRVAARPYGVLKSGFPSLA
jgi:hypothetical protein